MAYVVTDNCQACRFTECVSSCPVACFHFDENMLYINPEVCIDCSACETACPVQAIHDIATLPDELDEWIEINAERSQVLPIISEAQEPLPTAEKRKSELGF
jgi:ferredoxin